MNHLTDYLVCNIDIEKSTTALHLEKEYGIEWGFNQQTPLDSHFHLKACITKPVKINPHSVMPMPTGIYPQLKNPNFETFRGGTYFDNAGNENGESRRGTTGGTGAITVYRTVNGGDGLLLENLRFLIGEKTIMKS